MADARVPDGVLLLEHQLRMHSARIDLANNGRYRSTYLLDEFFFELVELARPGLFVEAGAFDAAASLRVAAMEHPSRVVAFEANPSNFELWTRKTDFAGHGVEYLHLAVSDTGQPVTFHVRSGSGDDTFEDNSILPRAGGVAASPDDLATVDSVTLDGYFGSSTRSALWVDVEGANEQVLTGATEFLGTCDVLKIEVEDTPLWEGQWLAGDVLESVVGSGMWPLARDVQADGQYNLVFVGERLVRDPRVVSAHDHFLRAQLKKELPGVLGKVRRHPQVRRAARALRR
jgi:FkbM family methyltransferase